MSRYLAFVALLVALVSCKGDAHKPFGSTAGTGVTPAGTGGPLGCNVVDQWNTSCSQGVGYTNIPANVATTIWTYDLAPLDFDSFATHIKTEIPGFTAANQTAWAQRKFFCSVISGTCTTPAGGTSDTAVDSQIGAASGSPTLVLAQVGSQVVLQITCTSQCIASGTVDIYRSTQAPAVLAVSPSTIAAPTTSDTVVTLTSTAGASTRATDAKICTTALQRCVPLNDHQAQCILPAGSGAAGTCDVSMTSEPYKPFALLGGFTFTSAGDAGAPDAGPGDSGSDAADSGSAPTLTTLTYPLLARADGTNQPITLGGTLLTGVTGVTVNGVAASSVSSTASTVTFTAPANTSSGSTAYAIVVTNPNGSATAALGAPWSNTTNVIYYVPTATPLLFACGQGTTIATGISSWVDVVGGVTAVQATGATQPTLVSVNSGKYCKASFNGSQAIAAPAYTCPAQTYGLAVAGFHAASGTQQFLQTNTTEINAYFDGTHVSLYGGSTLSGSLTATAMASLYFTFGGGSSGITINGASGAFGAGGANVCSGQFVIGAANGSGAVGLNGGISFMAVDTAGANSAFWRTLSQTLAGAP